MSIAEAVKAEEKLTHDLDPYVGKYVALYQHEVIDHDDDYDELIQRVVGGGVLFDRVFRVLSGENKTFVF